jgi:hypothetical protein
LTFDPFGTNGPDPSLYISITKPLVSNYYSSEGRFDINYSAFKKNYLIVESLFGTPPN